MDYRPDPNFYYSSPLNMQYAATGADLSSSLMYPPTYGNGQYVEQMQAPKTEDN
jgi:hypothetical protein